MSSRQVARAGLVGIAAVLLLGLLIPMARPVSVVLAQVTINVYAGRGEDDLGLGPGFHTARFQTADGVRMMYRVYEVRAGDWYYRLTLAWPGPPLAPGEEDARLPLPGPPLSLAQHGHQVT